VTQGFKRMSKTATNAGQSLIAAPRPKRLSMNKYGTVTHANATAVKLDKIPDLYSMRTMQCLTLFLVRLFVCSFVRSFVCLID
jgi:hypothetical protein